MSNKVIQEGVSNTDIHYPYPWSKDHFDKAIRDIEHQALLLCGVKGLGKRSLAKSLANHLLCQHWVPEPQCSHCHWFATHVHPDVMIITPEKRHIGVDKIRQIDFFASSTPSSAPKKIVIIESAECMNVAASNALLKMLEEPKRTVHWILVSDAFERLLKTIISRTQRCYLNAPLQSDALSYVKTRLAQIGQPREDGELLGYYQRCGGAPLEMLALCEKDISSTILPFLFTPICVASVAEKWANCDADAVFETLLLVLRDAKMYQLSPIRESSHLMPPMFPGYATQISSWATQVSAKSLGGLWDKVIQMRAKVLKERGLNGAMLYISLLSDWMASSESL